ncbi:MAG: hypothetical protein M3Y21_02120 [Candidatus Eremiobacteraeota bacterium]|nr:hypothetical protein [Candidatus Eremiobacteraeota bacterium]
MISLKRSLAVTVLTSMCAAAVPAVPALANGAASTRNIFLGAAAATYLIIQHNRKVHQRYAEDSRRQAATQQQADNSWAAYHSEQNAYSYEAAQVSDLKREVAYQHGVIVQQRQQLAMAPTHRGFISEPSVAMAPALHHSSKSHSSKQVAMVSYGWGTL